MPGVIRLLLSPGVMGLFSAVLLALSYPKPGISVLAWAALAPFVYALSRIRKSWQAFFLGWYSGFIFYSAILYWIYYTCRAGGMSPVSAVLAWALLSALLAAQWALFGWCAHRLLYADGWFAFAAAAGWVSIEWAGVELTRWVSWFPWFLLGYTQWNNTMLIQAAAYSGSFGISFAVAFFGISLGRAACKGRTPRDFLEIMAPPAVLAVLLLAFGYYRLGVVSAVAGDERPLQVSVIQPNVEQYKKWDQKFDGWIEQALAEQLKTAALETPELVVWPESALPGWIEDARYRDWVSAMARKMDCYQLVGAVSGRDGINRVSAVLFGPDGKTKGFYDKRKLVPFGEYIPLKSMLEKYIDVLGRLGGFAPGAMRQNLLKAADVSIGATICYESIFPYLWLDNARAGAQLFVNMTNDGWYLDTAGPYQHFAANIFRAVENDTPVVRAANTGISALIDRFGRVRVASRLNEATVLSFSVPARAGGSFYTKYGNIFALCCTAVFITFLSVIVIFI